ncbi:hypothetical protein ACSBR2_002935 [Camellia fascicularis]
MELFLACKEIASCQVFKFPRKFISLLDSQTKPPRTQRSSIQNTTWKHSILRIINGDHNPKFSQANSTSIMVLLSTNFLQYYSETLFILKVVCEAISSSMYIVSSITSVLAAVPSSTRTKHSSMEKKFISDIIQLPPGFRFHPSDEELIVHYLKNKATSSSLPASIIAEVDLYKCNPWELPGKALFGEEEWYFFTPRDRKYPNGVRPNRMAGSGFWKATGTDKPIPSSCSGKPLGVKKALVFYKVRPPRGVKTDWIMNEYRLPEATMLTSRQKGCMRLDDWVLCRVRQKSNISRKSGEDGCGSNNEPFGYSQKGDKHCSNNTNPNLEIIRDFLYRDCLVLPLIFASQDLPSLDTVSSIPTSFCEDYSATNYSQYSVPPFDNLNNGQKRKLSEGNQYDYSIQPKKKLTGRDNHWSDNIPVLNFCSTDQYEEGNNFNANQWNSIIQYQELNNLTFID